MTKNTKKTKQAKRTKQTKKTRPKKKAAKPLKIVLIVLGIVLGAVLGIILLTRATLILIGIYNGISSDETRHNNLLDSAGDMQQYLENKYGKDEQFEFTGSCNGYTPYGCSFKSAYTNGDTFIVYHSTESNPMSDNYVETKFRLPVRNYFNEIFKDINSIDSRIGELYMAGFSLEKPTQDEAQKTLAHLTVENFIENELVIIQLGFKISSNDLMTEPKKNKAQYQRQVTNLAQQEIENSVLKVLQEKQVPKNINNIQFAVWDNTSIEGFCMSYTQSPNKYTGCHHY